MLRKTIPSLNAKEEKRSKTAKQPSLEAKAEKQQRPLVPTKLKTTTGLLRQTPYSSRWPCPQPGCQARKKFPRLEPKEEKQQ